MVEEKLAGGGALLDGEGGEGGRFFVGFEHLAEVDGGEDVDVVEEEGFVWLSFLEEPGGFFQAAAGVEEEVVLRPFNSTRALGMLSVRGRRRVPRPAARIMAFIGENRQSSAEK